MAPGSGSSSADGGGRGYRVATGVVGLCLTLLSLGWIGGLHRQAGAILFAQQPMALALSLALLSGGLIVMGRRPLAGRLVWQGAALVLAVSAGAFFVWIAVDYQTITMQAIQRPEWLAWLCGAALLILLLLIWRLIGVAIAIGLVIFAIVAIVGSAIGVPTVAPDRLALYLVTDASGLLNVPLRVAVEIVIPFIFFGRLLEVTGGSAWFTDLSQTAFGRYRGGAAKVSVAASALFGSVSGNAVSNVVGTGVITIPLMVKSGYRARTAGAIEAVASTGGQLLPPVMGTAAFVMADFLRVPYAQILLAAAVPALLYFAAVFIQVDRIAARDRIRGVGTPGTSVVTLLVAGIHFVIPFIVLFVAFLVLAARPQTAALYAIGSIILVGVVRGYRGHRITLSTLLEAAWGAGTAAVPVVLVTAAAGLLIGLINITGASFSLALDAIALSGGNAVALLMIVAVTAIILGMGMPTVAVYILLATLLAPALASAGFGGVEAHLFILYFGMMSMVTPPIALAAITAANIAGANSWSTSWSALGLAWVAYVVPFLFVFSPALVLQAPWPLVLATLGTALAGIYCISAGTVGFHRASLNSLHRLAWVVGGVLLFVPPGLGMNAFVANGIGAVLFITLMIAGRRVGMR